jgi:hypothetical protein
VSQASLFGYEKDNPSNEYLKTQILGQSSNSYNGTETTYTANLEGALDFSRPKFQLLTGSILLIHMEIGPNSVFSYWVHSEQLVCLCLNRCGVEKLLPVTGQAVYLVSGI